MAVALDNPGRAQGRVCDRHKNTKLVAYQGAPHGLCTTHKQQVNEDLLAFIKG